MRTIKVAGAVRITEQGKEFLRNALATPDPASSSGTPRPNIKYAARDILDKHKRKVVKAFQPVERIKAGRDIIELPPADFQKRRRLFYHESATRIVRLLPHLYKLVRPK